MEESPSCPDCGASLADDSWSEELCPGCLLRLALVESSDGEAASGELETDYLPARTANPLTPGQILGNRYGVRKLLGKGGMGEVWRAFDLKLRVDVALKAVRSDLLAQPRLLDTLRQEVRAAREVTSPNVCRIYDLEELEGRELVSMEYVGGTTLLDILLARGPLELQEAREIASQLLAGLEAIHAAGLVHRDLKPENVMITPSDRVVVMDFGIAKGLAEASTGTVSGTPAYMAPEQAVGEAVDARADVFSAGVLLAEMLAPQEADPRASREALWRAVREEPPQLVESPWRPVLERALSRHPEQRYATASALARSLEEVALRVEGAEDRHPYPGLAAFTEANAEYFFGRELEVERMWKRLRRLHMLALVGPSGAGKTSFLRAGLLASEPASWTHVVCTPGSAPFTALREALVPVLSGDSDAMRELVRVEDPDAVVSAVSRWRGRCKHALVVVDQFEELFTLNPEEVRAAFAELLGRLALEADVRVLLSLRDDFLINCHAYEALRPLLTELTLLGPPTGAALRRAVVQPALKCGYRFEDEELVDEMLAEVEGERAALPLVAFAAEQLWERRDRERGLLTREAYEVIGGVGGALAQHAELSLERIGTDRTPVVRELFRNLVTAQGTRAVRDRDELLSVFAATSTKTNVGAGLIPARDQEHRGGQPPGYERGGARDVAEEVLDALIDARLLTSYSAEGVDECDDAGQRIEIVHESLLSAWPRLLRWMAQDVEGARMRDELRQAARAWQEHDRPDDRLWTGTALREYQLWRERYPGRLSELEEEFARATTRYATRRRRRRRTATVAGISLLLVVLAVVTGLWRRSELETRRAEASKLVTLGHLAMAKERTQALAYAIASLERADTLAGRLLALKSLWSGPPATVVPSEQAPFWLAFSPDGHHLAAGYGGARLRVFPRQGGEPAVLSGFTERDQGGAAWLGFSRDSRLLIASDLFAREVRGWETAGWEQTRVLKVPGVYGAFGLLEPESESILTLGFLPQGGPGVPLEQQFGQWLLHRWPTGSAEPQLLGSVKGTALPLAALDPSRSVVAVGQGRELHLHRIDTFGREPPQVIAGHDQVFMWPHAPAFDPVADRLALADANGPTALWPLDGDGRQPDRVLDSPARSYMAFSPDGSLLAQALDSDAADVLLWDLAGPVGAEPLELEYGLYAASMPAFSPDSRWLATTGSGFGLALWPIANPYCRVLRGPEGFWVRDFAVSPDGSHLFTQTQDGAVRSWPLVGGADSEVRVVLQTPPSARGANGLKSDPHGRFLIAGTPGGLWMVPLDGSEPTLIEGLPGSTPNLDPDGRRAAAVSESTVIVVDLETGERWQSGAPDSGEPEGVWFDFETADRLLVSRGRLISRWDLNTGSTEVLHELDGEIEAFWYKESTGKASLYLVDGRILVLNLDDGSVTPVGRREGGLGAFAGEKIRIIPSEDGSIRVAAQDGGEPHLLLGHEGIVADAFPIRDARDRWWVASTAEDGTIRLWPMPDLKKPPLHTLPHGELMAKLEALTNLRAVPDEESKTGYLLEADFDAYRGWAEVPQW